MTWTITPLLHTVRHEHVLQVQTAVGSLRESAVNRTSHLQKEISTAQDFTSSVREKWGFYMEETEKHYIEDTTAVDSGRSCLAEVLVEWSVVSTASCIHVMVVPSGPKRGCSEIWPSLWNYCSKAKTSMGAQQWKSAEDSLFSLGKGNVESVDSIVMYQNRDWHGQ